MGRSDIKPDHHIRAKRASLTGLTIGLLLLLQAVGVLWHFPENEGWRNALAGVSGLIWLLLCVASVWGVSETDAAVKTETN